VLLADLALLHPEIEILPILISLVDGQVQSIELQLQIHFLSGTVFNFLTLAVEDTLVQFSQYLIPDEIGG
jgi:hypothetical protein